MNTMNLVKNEQPLTGKPESELIHKKSWQGPENSIVFDKDNIYSQLADLSKPVFMVRSQKGTGVTHEGEFIQQGAKAEEIEGLASMSALSSEAMGDPGFKSCYKTRYAYYGGAMANGIASVRMVTELGKAGFLGSFGAASLDPSRLEGAIQQIQQALPDGPYAFNLIYSPNEEALERRAVELYLEYKVTCVEASAYIKLSPSIIYYRAAGLGLDQAGYIQIKNRVIAKVSRKEVASKFMQPAPIAILNQLLAEGKITELQAALAQKVPMADDVTVEGDSGGHTDNRPLVCLIPTMLALRDELQHQYHYPVPVRIGAAGGISTPAAALGAFMMGAAYIVTGSVNQACIEAGASDHTKKLLAQASMTDVTMAPAADMFEMGVRVQVLKNGTFFPMRAQKLYELYSRFNSIEELPAEEREKLEKQVFKRDLDSVWEDTVKFFKERDPDQVERASQNPKRKMALIFRWYLGLSSRWASVGDPDREMDYQIWCGPSIGPFNEWVRGTYLEKPENRRVADVAGQIMTGCTYLYRIQNLKMQGMRLTPDLETYHPAILEN
jgi:trans-AT polyketide synthase, acyltransferase and oxidoreductase domains